MPRSLHYFLVEARVIDRILSARQRPNSQESSNIRSLHPGASMSTPNMDYASLPGRALFMLRSQTVRWQCIILLLGPHLHRLQPNNPHRFPEPTLLNLKTRTNRPRRHRFRPAQPMKTPHELDIDPAPCAEPHLSHILVG
jgi:hypothetical protein